MEILPAVQKYAWGKVGQNSLVARFAVAATQNSSQQFGIEESETYAELWMGTHPNGPAKIRETGELLMEYVKKDPAVLGEKVRSKFGDNMPFLFKVLSVQKALSIQAHPNKADAEKLYATSPELYKDPNHKPEMAIALTPFEMLCGFRSLPEIACFLKKIPELQSIIGSELTDEFTSKQDKLTLKLVFTKLMESSPELIAAKLTQLLERVQSLDDKEKALIEGDLIKRLSEQFPNDVGIFCVYFLQHFTLNPGQAVFLPANEPHAYISGDCIECMAASDNVVRAGLTPKFKDVKTLCNMLTYDTGKDWIINGSPFANGTGSYYDPPVEEFAVIRYQSDGAFSLKPHTDSCSILICVEGQGKAVPQSGQKDKTKELFPGAVLFVPCGSELAGMQIIPSPKAGAILLYEAFATPTD